MWAIFIWYNASNFMYFVRGDLMAMPDEIYRQIDRAAKVISALPDAERRDIEAVIKLLDPGMHQPSYPYIIDTLRPHIRRTLAERIQHHLPPAVRRRAFVTIGG